MNSASAGGESPPLSLSLSGRVIALSSAETGRARRPKTVDSGFGGGCYRLPATWTRMVSAGTKFGSISFVGEERQYKGSTSAAVHASPHTPSLTQLLGPSLILTGLL